MMRGRACSFQTAQFSFQQEDLTAADSRHSSNNKLYQCVSVVNQIFSYALLKNAVKIAALLILTLLSFNANSIAQAQTLPAGFTLTQLATGLSSPTAFAFAPDGRIFVCLQGGQVRVIKNGALLPTPFVSLSVDPNGERGLLGIAFDPGFASNGYVYLYYTVNTTPRHNRVSRFTANGDVAQAGSEVLILRLDNLSNATNHNGGAMHFGADGKLFIAVGENATPSNSQTLGNMLGKMLRINSDGTIPTDNPFFNTATGNNRAIWTLGLRNPFTFAFQPGSARMFINDVGQNAFEEINDGVAGANYGWPSSEGPTTNTSHRGPVFFYGHGAGPTTGCAITGGAFYNPSARTFPIEYEGKYFFADFCSGWIRQLDTSTNNSSDFATGFSSPVDLRTGPDGALYVLARGGGGQLLKVQYTASQTPNITTHPVSQTVPSGQAATFTVAASGTGPLSYQWQRNGANIPGATLSSYTINTVSQTDSGAKFRVIVSNNFGSATSNEAVLTVTPNQPPQGNITSPSVGAKYRAGETIQYAGEGTDAENGTLPASAFTWRVDFHHDDHNHPFLPAASGSKTGAFTIPTSGETSSNVFYRIHLTVTDSEGLTHSSFRDILPIKTTITLASNPSGLQLTLDGQPVTAPSSVESVVGMRRTIGVLSPQTLQGVTYEFLSWSDGGAASHEISTPEVNTTFTATFSSMTVPSTFQFSAASYLVAENGIGAQLTVTRSGDTSQPASVDYETSDETAKEKSDYNTTLGTLDFEPGETSKSFTVLITDDGLVEGNKNFSVALSNPTGGPVLGSQKTASVQIAEDDTIQASVNPIEEAQFFVRQHYHDFLNREPDADGLQFWVNQITECGSNAGCREVRRINVSAAFFFSIEFQQTGLLVYRANRAGLGLTPMYRDFMRDSQRLGRGVIVGQGNWEELLAANQSEYMEDFVVRQDFLARYPSTQTPEQYVDALNANTGMPLSQTERDALVNGLKSGSQTRATVFYRVLSDDNYARSLLSSAFVLMEYFGYLRRDADQAGFDFWLGKLNRHNGNFIEAEMVKAFITSAEYVERFGR